MVQLGVYENEELTPLIEDELASQQIDAEQAKSDMADRWDKFLSKQQTAQKETAAQMSKRWDDFKASIPPSPPPQPTPSTFQPPSYGSEMPSPQERLAPYQAQVKQMGEEATARMPEMPSPSAPGTFQTGIQPSGDYAPGAVAAAMRQAGFPESEIARGVAISTAESGRRYGATAQTPKEYSVGPWQINLKAHGSAISETDARDLQKSTDYAYSQWKAHGWAPWATYTSGAYEKFMGASQGPSPIVFPVSGYSGKVEPHWGESHNAADLFAAKGTPVVAAAGGKVLSVGSQGPGGNNLTIQGDDGNQYYYAHLDGPPTVKTGEIVAAGTQIGVVGNTGNAANTPPHLHFGMGTTIRAGTGPEGGAGSGNVDVTAILNQVLTGGPPTIQPSGRLSSGGTRLGAPPVAQPAPAPVQPEEEEPTTPAPAPPAPTGREADYYGPSAIMTTRPPEPPPKSPAEALGQSILDAIKATVANPAEAIGGAAPVVAATEAIRHPEGPLGALGSTAGGVASAVGGAVNAVPGVAGAAGAGKAALGVNTPEGEAKLGQAVSGIGGAFPSAARFAETTLIPGLVGEQRLAAEDQLVTDYYRHLGLPLPAGGPRSQAARQFVETREGLPPGSLGGQIGGTGGAAGAERAGAFSPDVAEQISKLQMATSLLDLSTLMMPGIGLVGRTRTASELARRAQLGHGAQEVEAGLRFTYPNLTKMMEATEEAVAPQASVPERQNLLQRMFGAVNILKLGKEAGGDSEEQINAFLEKFAPHLMKPETAEEGVRELAAASLDEEGATRLAELEQQLATASRRVVPVAESTQAMVKPILDAMPPGAAVETAYFGTLTKVRTLWKDAGGVTQSSESIARAFSEDDTAKLLARVAPAEESAATPAPKVAAAPTVTKPTAATPPLAPTTMQPAITAAMPAALPSSLAARIGRTQLVEDLLGAAPSGTTISTTKLGDLTKTDGGLWSGNGRPKPSSSVARQFTAEDAAKLSEHPTLGAAEAPKASAAETSHTTLLADALEASLKARGVEMPPELRPSIGPLIGGASGATAGTAATDEQNQADWKKIILGAGLGAAGVKGLSLLRGRLEPLLMHNPFILAAVRGPQSLTNALATLPESTQALARHYDGALRVGDLKATVTARELHDLAISNGLSKPVAAQVATQVFEAARQIAADDAKAAFLEDLLKDGQAADHLIRGTGPNASPLHEGWVDGYRVSSQYTGYQFSPELSTYLKHFDNRADFLRSGFAKTLSSLTGAEKQIFFGGSPVHFFNEGRQYVFTTASYDLAGAAKGLLHSTANFFSPKKFDEWYNSTGVLATRMEMSQIGITGVAEANWMPELSYGQRFVEGRRGVAIRGVAGTVLGGASGVLNARENPDAEAGDILLAGAKRAAISAGIAAFLPPIFTPATFTRAIPTMKIYAYRILKDVANMSDAELSTFINQKFGGINTRVIGRSPGLEWAYRNTAQAADWWEGQLRSVVGASQPGKLGAAERRYWMTAAVMGLTVNEGLNYAFTGHSTLQNAPGHELDVDITPVAGTNTDRFGYPIAVYLDDLGPIRAIFEAAHSSEGGKPDPGAFARNRMGATAPGALFNLATNFAGPGQEIAKAGTPPGEAFPNYAWETAGNLSPISAQSLESTPRTEQALGPKLLGMATGLRPSYASKSRDEFNLQESYKQIFIDAFNSGPFAGKITDAAKNVKNEELAVEAGQLARYEIYGITNVPAAEQKDLRDRFPLVAQKEELTRQLERQKQTMETIRANRPDTRQAITRRILESRIRELKTKGV